MSDLPVIEDAVQADLNDGVTAMRHPVRVTWGPAGLSVAGDEIAETIAWSGLTWIDLLPEAILLGRTDEPGWRLRLDRDAPADLVARLPQRPRFGRWIDRFGFGKSLVCFAAVSSMVAFVAINTPSWLGRRVPISWEAGMSDDNLEV